jgi:hypothetical protein
MLAGLGTAFKIEAKPKLTYKELKSMNDSDKD